MATYAGNQTAAYKQQSILTAPPGRLVVMLYDGCLRFLFQSAYAMREGDRAVAGPHAPRRGDHRRADRHARPRARRRDRQPPAGHLRLLPPSPDRGGAEQDPTRSTRSPSCSASCARPGPRSPAAEPRPPGPSWSRSPSASSTSSRDGRWEEVPAVSDAAPARRAALGTPPAAARPHLERLAELQRGSHAGLVRRPRLHARRSSARMNRGRDRDARLRRRLRRPAAGRFDGRA